MALLDPAGGASRILRSAPKRFQLKLHNIAPEHFIPNGDRYIVEVIDFDDVVELGQMLVAVQDPQINPTDPKADPSVEVRGVLGGVIVRGGNGHLLGLPDPRLVTWLNPMTDQPTIVREPADVPMFYQAGDVVFVDRNAKGRNLRVVGREVRIVNQIDILAKIDGIRLVRDEDGNWTDAPRDTPSE